MKKLLESWVFSIILLTSVMTVGAREVDYGLKFRSHETIQDERTGLNLNPKSPFRFRDGFSLEFDIRFYDYDFAYGYVFRIISSNSTSLDFVSNIRSDKFNFILSQGHTVVGNVSFSDSLDLDPEKWYHVIVDATRDGSISCYIDGQRRIIEGMLPDMRDVDIRFGWNDHPVFYTTDVAPMSIKNISLSDARGYRSFFWQLYHHNETEVYDLNEDREALVKDGIWLADSYCQWEKVASLSTCGGSTPLLTYDDVSSRLFVATLDSVYTYTLDERTVSVRKVKSGTPAIRTGNQMVYDPLKNRLLCYSMYDARLAVYDFETASWTGSFVETWPPLVGHNHLFDPVSGKLHIFGGYGNHRYKSDFMTVDVNTAERTVSDISEDIWPRYFGAMGRNDSSELVLMGGFGNSSGLQEESPANLQDIYRINPVTLECSPLGTFRRGNEPYAFASSLLCKGDDIYTLVFNNNRFKTNLRLTSYTVGADSLAIYADPIAYSFQDTDAWSDLVFSPDSSRFYAIVLNAGSGNRHELNVWALDYPPLSDISQSVPTGFPTLVMVLIILAVLAVPILVLLFRRYSAVKVSVDDIPKQAFTISMLGGFRVCDKNGEDITSRLTSVPRQILIYFLLRYAGNKRGLTSVELDEKFWFGMERTAASNNRNVNIRKLRIVLKDVGNIAIVYDNDVWSLSLGDVTCDYCALLPMLQRMQASSEVDISLLVRVLSIVHDGQLLAGYEYEWLDKYKSKYADIVISVLTKAAKDPVVIRNKDLLLRVAECLLIEDSLDEFAVRVKCSTLYEMGHKGKSKQTFDQYCQDYIRILDSIPNVQYDSFIS